MRAVRTRYVVDGWGEGELWTGDGVVNDQDGEPMTIPNAICMHEEDAGIAWKHTDFSTEAVEVRRARRLVISTIATVGLKVGSRRAIWPWREKLIDSPRMRAASCGAWKPVEFSASTKSR